jgi:hypothetical protein
MKRHKALYLITGFIVIAASVSAPVAASADDGAKNFTLYSYAEDGINSGSSADLLTSPPTGGGAFFQSSRMFPTPVTEAQAKDPSYVATNSVGKLVVACTIFAGLQDPPRTPTPSFRDSACNVTLAYNNGQDSINAQGYFQEFNQVPPGCPDSVNAMGISGGTGKYEGARGQLNSIHKALNPDPGNDCAHTKHNYVLNVRLLN